MHDLTPDEIHIWRISLNPPEPVRLARDGALSDEERARASRFRFVRDRRRFGAARGALRQILARYLGCADRDVSFSYGHAGKPRLDGPGRDLEFNLSHAGELAIVGVGLGRRIGVDVEGLRDLDNLDAMVRRFFSAGEKEDYFQVPTDHRTLAFFSGWTRKEAFIKATGDGLGMPLDRFRVSLVPGRPAALLETADDPAEAARWRVETVGTPPEYVAAVAAESGDWTLVERDWTP